MRVIDCLIPCLGVSIASLMAAKGPRAEKFAQCPTFHKFGPGVLQDGDRHRLQSVTAADRLRPSVEECHHDGVGGTEGGRQPRSRPHRVT